MPGVVAGFLESLQLSGTWDLERRLLVRPFPQPVRGGEPDMAQWSALRTEMARVSGAVIFVGGANLETGTLIDARGVFAEKDAADQTGAFLLPIGFTGGAAATIARSLIKSDVPSAGTEARRPSDTALTALLNITDDGEAINLIVKILRSAVIGDP